MSDPVLPAYVKGLFHQLVKAVGGVEAAGAFLGVSHQRISQLQTTTCADMPTVMQIVALESACGLPVVTGALCRRLTGGPGPEVRDAMVGAVGSASEALRVVHDAERDGKWTAEEVARAREVLRRNLEQAQAAYDAGMARTAGAA